MVRAMSRTFPLIAVILVAAASGAAAQDAPPPVTLDEPPPVTLEAESLPAQITAFPAAGEVGVRNLAAPDAFSTPGRATGLPATLWRGASLKTARTVLPLLATQTLSPAGAALARRVLAAGAPGPQNVGDDAGLAGARAAGLLAQGDPKAAAEILAHAPGVDRDPDLARVTAESALLAGDDARACAVAQGLGSGRDEIYWLRLRTYCQALAGQSARAQLTFEIAQVQARDAIFARLMGAKLAGVGDPGAPSLRNGLDYALSKSLGLDLSVAEPSPAVAAALTAADPQPLVYDLTAVHPDLAPLAEAVSAGRPIPDAVMAGAIVLAAATDPKDRARGQAATLLAAAFSATFSPDVRGQISGLTLAEGKAPLGRNLALDEAAAGGLAGEAAMLSLWTCAEAGPAGPTLADRIRIVHALYAVGLDADARAFALEGLMALK